MISGLNRINIFEINTSLHGQNIEKLIEFLVTSLQILSTVIWSSALTAANSRFRVLWMSISRIELPDEKVTLSFNFMTLFRPCEFIST